MNIVEQIYQNADRKALALCCDERAVTYGELLETVDALAAALKNSGALNGISGVPRIGLSCPNGVAHVALALAALRVGGCLVPVASELSDRERDALVKRVGLHAVIATKEGRWPLAKLTENESARWTELETAGIAFTLFYGLLETPPEFDEQKLDALNPVFIRFSSGTTGESKGVVLSHESLLERITVANHRLAVSEKDRVVWILPMAHHFAVSIMLYLLRGATTVISASHLAEDVLRAARRWDGTILYAAPFHHSLLAAEGSDTAWPTLRLAVSTAAPLSLATARAFETRFGISLSQGLGIIEAGMPLLNTQSPQEKPLSVGQPWPDFEIELRDENAVKVEPNEPNEPGEIFLKGPGMFDAYLSPWKLRADVTRDGWFATGDLATMDAAGFIKICGRSKSVINVAGMKCFPEEIEAVLCEHPKIAAARVSGRDHDRVGNVPVAEIILRKSEPLEPPPIPAELSSYCRKALANYKVPVDFQFVEKLPRTASGKIRR